MVSRWVFTGAKHRSNKRRFDGNILEGWTTWVEDEMSRE